MLAMLPAESICTFGTMGEFCDAFAKILGIDAWPDYADCPNTNGCLSCTTGAGAFIVSSL